MKTEFTASLDKWALGITLGVTAVFVLVLGGIVAGSGTGSAPYATALVAGVVMGGVLLFCYLFGPQRYRLTANSLVIVRPIGNKHISLARLEEVRPLAPEELRWSLRTFGNGGLFGFYGNFWNSKLGLMTWYATRRSNYVLVRTASASLVLTPDDPNGFLAALAAVPVAAGS